MCLDLRAHLRVVQGVVGERAQEVEAVFAHFFAPLPRGLFVGGVEAGARGFAHVAGCAAFAEVFGAQGAVVEEFDGELVDVRAHGFDEVAGEGFPVVGEAVVEADAGVEADEVDLFDHFKV